MFLLKLICTLILSVLSTSQVFAAVEYFEKSRVIIFSVEDANELIDFFRSYKHDWIFFYEQKYYTDMSTSYAGVKKDGDLILNYGLPSRISKEAVAVLNQREIYLEDRDEHYVCNVTRERCELYSPGGLKGNNLVYQDNEYSGNNLNDMRERLTEGYALVRESYAFCRAYNNFVEKTGLIEVQFRSLKKISCSGRKRILQVNLFE